MIGYLGYCFAFFSPGIGDGGGGEGSCAFLTFGPERVRGQREWLRLDGARRGNPRMEVSQMALGCLWSARAEIWSVGNGQQSKHHKL